MFVDATTSYKQHIEIKCIRFDNREICGENVFSTELFGCLDAYLIIKLTTQLQFLLQISDMHAIDERCTNPKISVQMSKISPFSNQKRPDAKD